MASDSVVELDYQNWEKEVVTADCLVLVEFWHTACPWCRLLEPTYNELTKEYVGKVKFARLNVFANKKNQDIAVHYGIMSTPTLIFLCHGRPMQGNIGLMPKPDFQKLVNDVLDKYKVCMQNSTELKIP